MCKDPVAGGSMMHSQNKHGILEVRGSMASLKREADIRKYEECGLASSPKWERSWHPEAATAVGIWEDVFLEGTNFISCRLAGNLITTYFYEEMRNKSDPILLLAYFWNNIAHYSHAVERQDSFSLLQNQTECVQIMALPLLWCVTLISSPNLCFSFLKFQIEKYYYLPQRINTFSICKTLVRVPDS